MYYENYNFVGMHLVWWIIWMTLLIWIFATPYNIPGQRIKTNDPLDILKKRFASGQINKDEYQEKKKLLEA
jgi:putative membrane protein